MLTHHLIRTSLSILLVALVQVWPLSNTGGIPIGGMGTGYVKYNARTGDFAASGKVPPAGSDRENEFLEKKSISSGFHFYAGGQSVIKIRSNDENARFPLYTADFDIINNVAFSLRAFGPFIPGSDKLNYQLATSPVAYFEVTATNKGSKAIDVAVAMEFTNRSATQNLLGGTDGGEIDEESGDRGISFPGTPAEGNAYLCVSADGASPYYSAGTIDSFPVNGMLTNTTGKGNLVAAKCTIPPYDGTVKFKFTLAWWRMFVSTTDRYGSGKTDSDNYYYHNFYTSSKQAAAFGSDYFDLVSNGIERLVNRVMGSNFPDWYKERLLNNLYPMVQNAICTEDGRTAFWEGLYPIIGSIDQSEHASLWYTFNWPQNQWHELQYWLRTAHRGIAEDSTLKGQIHHDFNASPATWTFDSRFLCPWDDYLRNDYWWQTNTTDWSDLNIMVIFKMYELMLATGDRDSMTVYYPKILHTAERLLLQCSNSGKKLPLKTKCTYDTDGLLSPQYVSGISLVAFLAIEEMAKFMGDTATMVKYHQWYTEARNEFKTLLFNDDFCSVREFAEGDIAGYSWSNYFCLEPVMDTDVVNEGCNRLQQLYWTNADTADKLGLWHFYNCDHIGGAEIARGNSDIAMSLFELDYEYFHHTRPAFVFGQSLWTSNHDTYDSYVTAPSVWRSCFQITGYLLDNANKRLWIRPRIPASMNGTITKAPLLNPAGWGTLDYKENNRKGAQLTQQIKVSFDTTVVISELVLKNNTGSTTPFLNISNSTSGIDEFSISPEERQGEKNIRISFAEPIEIDKNGLYIDVYASETSTHSSHDRRSHGIRSFTSQHLAAGKPVVFSVDRPGKVKIDLFMPNGARIGTIFERSVESPGSHSFIWNGMTLDGGRIATKLVIMRLTTESGSMARQGLIQIN